MTKNMIDLLENELEDLLRKHPHLLELQFKISKNLAKFDSREDRLYYLSTELFDSFDELREKLSELHIMLEELK